MINPLYATSNLMKFSLIAVSSLLTSSLAFAPGDVFEKGVRQYAFKTTSLVISSSRPGSRNIKLSLFNLIDVAEKTTEKGTIDNETPPLRERKQNKFKLPGKGTALRASPKGTFSIGNKKPPLFNKNVPTMRNWKENADGSISGSISGSDMYRDDVFVTTSPLKGPPSADKIVTSISGTKYFLEGEEKTDKINASVSHSWKIL